MTKEELKQEAKKYARRKFDEQEQIYLHAIIAQAYIDGAEPREKRIAELEKEKENAELKAVHRMALYSKLSDQLAKAKELLKRCYDTYVYEVSVRREIEQFLKEIEK